MTAPEILINQQAITGEAPSWDARNRVLYWVDIPRATIFIYHPDSGHNECIDLSSRFQTIGTLAPIHDGGLLFTPDRKIARLDPVSHEVTILAEVETDLPGNRFNDGKCDPAGRFLAGTMKKSPDGEAAGSLYSFDPHTGVRKLLDGLVIPNGLGWSPDYHQFYLGDSMSRDVWVFDYDLEKGEISNRRVAYTLPPGIAVADGLTTDMDGMVWQALWDGACITRWNPHTGELLASYPFPAKRTACCAFGGSNMNDLYVTSAAEGMTDQDWQDYPYNGALMRIKTPFTGMATFKFAG
jgi:sugar lactone lactonase YvrE